MLALFRFFFFTGSCSVLLPPADGCICCSGCRNCCCWRRFFSVCGCSFAPKVGWVCCCWRRFFSVCGCSFVPKVGWVCCGCWNCCWPLLPWRFLVVKPAPG